MSPDAHRRLVELDAHSREARAFYEHAAAVLPASALRERCLRLAKTKAELVAMLAQQLRGGDPRVGRAFAARRAGPAAYAQVRIGPATPDLARLSDALERIEAAVAQDCEAQADGSPDADCRRVMAWVLPVLEVCREQVQVGEHPPSLH